MWPLLLRGNTSSLVRRYCSTPKEWQVPATPDIPKEKLHVTFCRSSGPGGQNVNKRSTQAQVRIPIQQQDWMPTYIRDALHNITKAKQTSEGELIIASTEHRTQHRNLEECYKKFRELLRDANDVANGRATKAEKLAEKIRKNKDRARRRHNKKILTTQQNNGVVSSKQVLGTEVTNTPEKE